MKSYIRTSIFSAIVMSLMMAGSSCSNKGPGNIMDMYAQDDLRRQYIRNTSQQVADESTRMRVQVAYEGEELTEREE